MLQGTHVNWKPEIQRHEIDEPSMGTLERKGRLGELLHKFDTLRNRK